MFKPRLPLLIALLIIALPAALFAAPNDRQAEFSETEEVVHQIHESIGSHIGMMSLGECERNGVKATAMIKAYDLEAIEALQAADIEASHHLMIFFNNAETGMRITDGLAAVRTKDASENESKPLKLLPMAEGFGADMVLPYKSDYEIEFGTKLMDGKKRQFQFFYLNLNGEQLPERPEPLNPPEDPVAPQPSSAYPQDQ